MFIDQMLHRYQYQYQQRQAGISFVELLMFIVVVSVGIAGILSVMNFTTSRSADPLVLKQATAIAESLLEEIEAQPFTWCDPEDGAVTTVTQPSQCAVQENFGPENGQTRTTFNNVNDYVASDGVETSVAIQAIGSGTAPAGYNAFVTISQQAVSGVPATDSLRIDVRVTGPGGTNVSITGYRMRYAPTAG